MTEVTTISSVDIKPVPSDYEFLRAKGIEHLYKLGGKIWDDYNIHDPGVTILELLCYAITDLKYRTDFNIVDLLTEPGNNGPSPNNAFFSARQILTSHPITIEDYRRLVLDYIPGIRNIWFNKLVRLKPDVNKLPQADDIQEPFIFRNPKEQKLTFTHSATDTHPDPLALRGLYRVKVEYESAQVFVAYLETDVYKNFLNTELIVHHDPLLQNKVGVEIDHANSTIRIFDTDTNTIIPDASGTFTQVSDFLKDLTKIYLRYTLAGHRNLCEDFVDFDEAKKQEIGLCLDVELTQQANHLEVYKEIYGKVYNYVSPRLEIYSMEELLARGKKIEEIFEGIQPKRGFVDMDELRLFDRRRNIYVSDLIKLIMNIPGVLAVRSLHINSYIGSTVIDKEQAYCVHLQDPNNYAFSLAADFNGPSLTVAKNKIQLWKNGFKLPFSKSQLPYTLADAIGIKDYIESYEVDLAMPQGKNRDLERYYSIQNDFPDVYALGFEGLPSTATKLRKTQLLQLKGYLIFFEQLLADYLSQLNNVKHLLSWSGSTSDALSYFYQKLDEDEIAELNMVLSNSQLFQSSPGNPSQYTQNILESDSARLDRRSRLLDRLLGMFNEGFGSFSLMSFSFNAYQDVFGGNSSSPNDIATEIIDDKKAILSQYDEVSRNRSRAIDYLSLPDSIPGGALNLFPISGYERRINFALGINRDTQNSQLNYLQGFNILAHKIGEHTIVVNGQPETHHYFKDNTGEGFDQYFGLHIIEHILLRPLFDMRSLIAVDLNPTPPLEPTHPDFTLLNTCINDHDVTTKKDLCYCEDPYSFRISVVLPGYYRVSQNLEFRKFAEQVLREEAPAHIALKICWVDPIQMWQFEEAYKSFMTSLGNVSRDDSPSNRLTYALALHDLTTVVNRLKNIHPPSYLVDCDGVEYSSDGTISVHPVILGRTSIVGGNVKPYHFMKAVSEGQGWFYSGGGTVIDDPALTPPSGLPEGFGWPNTDGNPTWDGNSIPNGFMYKDFGN